SELKRLAALQKENPHAFERAWFGLKKAGVRMVELRRALAESGRGESGRNPDERRPPQFSDDSLAMEFSARHADTMRYVAAWGQWMRWTGTHWAQDVTLSAFDLARAVCREAAHGCGTPQIAAAIASAKTTAAVERLAKADRRHAATTDQWDSDVWLLNTPG